MKIFKKEIDIVEKHRVWVEVSQGELLMLKYEEEPTEEQCFEDAQRILDNENKIEVGETDFETDLLDYIKQKYEIED